MGYLYLFTQLNDGTKVATPLIVESYTFPLEIIEFSKLYPDLPMDLVALKYYEYLNKKQYLDYGKDKTPYEKELSAIKLKQVEVQEKEIEKAENTLKALKEVDGMMKFISPSNYVELFSGKDLNAGLEFAADILLDPTSYTSFGLLPFIKKGIASNSDILIKLLDELYFLALKNKDFKKAKQLVDDYFLHRNPNSVLNANHSSPNEFTEFKPTKSQGDYIDPFYHFGATDETTLWFRQSSPNYKTKNFHLILNNPLEVPDFTHDSYTGILNEMYKQGIINSDELRLYRDKFYRLAEDNPHEAVSEILKLKGYDGIKYINEIEAKGSMSYGIPNANQIKSADVITYDDNGNIIPLSKRFDKSKNDYRYMLAPAVILPSIYYQNNKNNQNNNINYIELFK